MRIVAYRTDIQDGTVRLEESTGEFALSNHLEDLASFLLEPYDNCIRICWDLDATVSLFLKLLGVARCLKLRDTKRCYWAPFNIFYVPGKVFSVSHIPTRTQASLYGIEQYFTELPEPERLVEVQMLGEKLMYELKKMGLEPTKLTSPIAIYEECVMRKLDLPALKDIPADAAEYAYRAAGRLWIETHTIGHFGKIYDYDLKSAFPNAVMGLIDTRDCWWEHTAQYQGKAIYGYARCRMTIYDWVMVSPIIMEIEDGLLSPVGTWEGYFTKGELDFVTKWGIGEYEIIDGYWALPRYERTLRSPLQEPMAKLLTYKQGTEVQALLAKRMSTGIYGKLGEERQDEFGPYFFPCWFAETSTQPKLQVGEFLYERGIGPGDNEGYKTLVHIGVDGTMLTEPVEIDDRWRQEYEGEALVFSSGLVYTQTTRPKGLTLSEVLEMIHKHPRVAHYEKKLGRRLTLGDSLARYKLGDIGTPVELSVSLSLVNQDHDRDFLKVPRSGEQLLNNKYRSTPRVVAPQLMVRSNGHS